MRAQRPALQLHCEAARAGIRGLFRHQFQGYQYVINKVSERLGSGRIALHLMAVATFAIPPILAAVLYAPSVGFDYVWDDRVLFVESTRLRLGDITWENVTGPLFENSVYVRPFALLTYMVQFQWFGPTPEMSHVVNIALHLANIAMVMVLAWLHGTRRGLGAIKVRVLVAGVIYALHPALIEPVVWASGRFDLLATTCVLAALIADLTIKSVLTRAAAVATAFALGLGSKEVAATLPLLLIAQRAALEAPSTENLRYLRGLLIRERWTVAICALVAAIYILIRMGATHRLLPPVSVAEELSNASMRVAYVFDTLGFYLQQGLAPWWGESMPLNPANAGAVLSPSRLPRVLAGLAFVALVLFAVRRRYYSGWMMACTLAALLPVLNIFILPLAGNIGFDRFLTLPLAFAALGIAGITVPQLERREIILRIALTLLLAFWMVDGATMVRATLPRWSNELTIWTWLHANPGTGKAAELNYVTAAIRADRYDLALEAFQSRLQYGPLEAEQQALYGLTLAHTGDPKEGLKYIAGAIRAYPPTSYAPSNWRNERGAAAFLRDRLGFAYFAVADAMILSGSPAQALIAAEESVKYRPGMVDALVVLSALRQALAKPGSGSLSLRLALAQAYPSERKRLERKYEAIVRRVSGIKSE
jgi:protein O-mannosyl-transferase